MPEATSLVGRSAVTKRPSLKLKGVLAERERWLGEVTAEGHFQRLFDYLPGLSFFAKDARGRFMLVSQDFAHHYGLRDAGDLIGRTDFDVSPPQMAMGYTRDDQELLSGKRGCVQRVELWFDDQGLPDWFFVTKLPLIGRRNKVVGTVGVLRRAGEQEMQLPVLQTVARAVEWIRLKHAGEVSIAEVARFCGLSLRQLQRRFQETFGFSPVEFLIRTRVRAAMKLLKESCLGASEVARRCGFPDASAFAEQFRQRTGWSPMRWRREG
jgi:AraC-like DNA-binding protein